VGEVADRNVLMVDDLTTTAGTLCAGARLLKEKGAKSILAAVTHCPITDEGRGEAEEVPDRGADHDGQHTAKDWHGFPVKVLSIADLLGEAILRVHNNQS